MRRPIENLFAPGNIDKTIGNGRCDYSTDIRLVPFKCFFWPIRPASSDTTFLNSLAFPLARFAGNAWVMWITLARSRFSTSVLSTRGTKIRPAATRSFCARDLRARATIGDTSSANYRKGRGLTNSVLWMIEGFAKKALQEKSLDKKTGVNSGMPMTTIGMTRLTPTWQPDLCRSVL